MVNDLSNGNGKWQMAWFDGEIWQQDCRFSTVAITIFATVTTFVQRVTIIATILTAFVQRTIH